MAAGGMIAAWMVEIRYWFGNNRTRVFAVFIGMWYYIIATLFNIH